jgi:hypothetical protein
MFQKCVVCVLVVLLAASLVSCFDNEEDRVTPAKSPYKSLAADQPRDNALFNLQVSYNERNIEHYDDLLDEGLEFYFGAEDVMNGNPQSWGRAAEMSAATNLFDPNYANPQQPAAQDIDLSLVYPQGDDEWTPIEPEDQVTYPGETWYQKIVTYNLTVQISGEFQYVGLNKQAAFVLRAATVESEQYWKIVVWRDDTGTYFRDAGRRDVTAGTAEDTTWGQLKAIYGE